MVTPSFQHVCDGCGATVDPEHIRERIARLEMATRFRPLHMNTLLLAGSPPAAVAEFFYSPERNAGGVGWADAFFRSVLAAAGAEADVSKRTEDLLASFQRHGYYLAFVNECPAKDGADIRKLGDVVLRRIRFSYKPKNVVLVGADAHKLHGFLSGACPLNVRVIAAKEPEGIPVRPDGDWARFQNILKEQVRAAAG